MPSQTCNLFASALAQCPCRQQVSQDEPEQQQPADLPSALAALEAERQRCRELVRLNAVLQEHLEIATRTNADLASEVHKLTKEWWQLNRSQSADQPQVLVPESEARAARAQASQLQGKLMEARKRLARERASHRAQVAQAARQRQQDLANWQRRRLHQAELALSAAQDEASELKAHMEAVTGEKLTGLPNIIIQFNLNITNTGVKNKSKMILTDISV
ncbi:uncharacterized protein [Dermacentor andersoni]|uniref:uncharacterized protein n=1 Tax=Dermacentor andersoni TaxID=34620 RepID=UPI003B3B3B1D